MKILIVEDERLAAQRLVTLINNIDPSIEILGCLESIAQTVEFLNTRTHPELLLLDIQLSDGPGFEIFKKSSYANAVIFTTAYDEFALQSFQVNNIDYILKPVTQEALANSFQKMRRLASCFSATPLPAPNRYKSRFIGKIGQRAHFIECAEISYFHADNKLTLLTDVNGTRYVIEHTLEKLEELLDPAMFFRLNRRYIVNVKAIQNIKPFYNHRLRLQVTGSDAKEEIVISRDRVNEFKKWAEGV
jgi:two-component system, LytTR family, response regulator LytT